MEKISNSQTEYARGYYDGKKVAERLEQLIREEIRPYFDDRADAETLPDQGDIGNEEMRLLGEIDQLLDSK